MTTEDSDAPKQISTDKGTFVNKNKQTTQKAAAMISSTNWVKRGERERTQPHTTTHISFLFFFILTK